jgi:hypothetical protein
MKRLLLVVLFLTGCTTTKLIPQQDLLNPPATLMTPVHQLQELPANATATDALKIVVANYGITREYAAEIQAWQDWLNQTNADIAAENKKAKR